MLFSKDYRQGREAQEIARRSFNNALEAWKKAPEKEKPKRALEVMSHVGSMGLKLKDLIEDKKVVRAIKEDAQKL